MQKKYSESDFGSVSEVTSATQPPANEAKIKRFLLEALNKHGLERGWAGVTFGELKRVANDDLQAIVTVLNDNEASLSDYDQDGWGWIVYTQDWPELLDWEVCPEDPMLYIKDGKMWCTGESDYGIEDHEIQDNELVVYFSFRYLMDGNSP